MKRKIRFWFSTISDSVFLVSLLSLSYSLANIVPAIELSGWLESFRPRSQSKPILFILVLTVCKGVVRAKSSLALLFTSTDNKSHFLIHTFLYLFLSHFWISFIVYISHILFLVERTIHIMYVLPGEIDSQPVSRKLYFINHSWLMLKAAV